MELLHLILYTIIFIGFLFTLKPNVLFKPNGNLRSYGVGYDIDGYKKSMFNIHLIIIIFIIITNKLMLKEN